MLLCAVHRAGRPKTAADLHDDCVGLAMSADWPRNVWAKWSAQKAAAALRSLESGELVERCGDAMVDGNPRPLWRPNGQLEKWENPNYPIPDPSDRENDKHEIDSMSRDQLITMLDVFGDVTAAAVRLRRSIETTVATEIAAFDDAIARGKRQLIGAGIPIAARREER